MRIDVLSIGATDEQLRSKNRPRQTDEGLPSLSSPPLREERKTSTGVPRLSTRKDQTYHTRARIVSEEEDFEALIPISPTSTILNRQGPVVLTNEQTHQVQAITSLLSSQSFQPVSEAFSWMCDTEAVSSEDDDLVGLRVLDDMDYSDDDQPMDLLDGRR